jgi:predicted site-specific integrase-resolvase
MTVSTSDTSEELMTRLQVAYLFRDTSAAVVKWVRRGLLPEVRNGAGRPRYRRTDVEELLRSGFRQKPR